MPSLRVIQTVGSLRLSAGGPTRTVTSLCEALGRLGVQVNLVSLDATGSDGDMLLHSPPELVKTTLVVEAVTLRKRLVAHSFRAAVRELCGRKPPTILHDNGTWMPNNHATAVVARELRIPLIISTRGMLEPWALAHRAWKKRLALLFYQRRDLETAAVLHATSRQEIETLRRLGFRKPIAMIPNGVSLPAQTEANGGTQSSESNSATLGSTRTALFLGRIHPVKGLLQLVDSWNKIRPEGWRLVIAGPDEGGHRAEVEARTRAHGVTENIEFSGSVDGPEKEKLYRSADLFVLPSFSENFGMVVAEALAYGVPVITTCGAPWAGLVHHRCGWWVESTADGIAEALREATSLDRHDLRVMGDRGRVFARQFDWNEIAKDTLAVYQWVLGQGERPACVAVD